MHSSNDHSTFKDSQPTSSSHPDPHTLTYLAWGIGWSWGQPFEKVPLSASSWTSKSMIAPTGISPSGPEVYLCPLGPQLKLATHRTSPSSKSMAGEPTSTTQNDGHFFYRPHSLTWHQGIGGTAVDTCIKVVNWLVPLWLAAVYPYLITGAQGMLILADPSGNAGLSSSMSWGWFTDPRHSQTQSPEANLKGITHASHGLVTGTGCWLPWMFAFNSFKCTVTTHSEYQALPLVGDEPKRQPPPLLQSWSIAYSADPISSLPIGEGGATITGCMHACWKWTIGAKTSGRVMAQSL